MTGGRVIFGSGPGALPSDAYMLGIDPMVQRDRQDEAIGVIRKLLRGGHDTRKVYAAYKAAVEHTGQPTVIASRGGMLVGPK